MHELHGVLADVKELSGQIQIDEPTLRGKVYVDSPILRGNVNIATKTYIHDRYPDYTGEYSVKPKVDEQILPTEHTSMQSDMTIEPIPYHEVSNEYGITVSIGS
jgi:hypothetical protein